MSRCGIAYDLKEAIDQVQPGLMRQAERFFILQQIDTLAGTPATDGCPARVGRTARLRTKGPASSISEGYELFLDMMINIRRNVVYSLFQFQPQIQPSVQAPSELV